MKYRIVFCSAKNDHAIQAPALRFKVLGMFLRRSHWEAGFLYNDQVSKDPRT